MAKTFNKLVRDNIPNIIKDNGEEAVIKVLGEKEFRQELYKKLLEETSEVIDAKKSEEIIEEVADVFEVLKTIVELENRTFDEVIEIANQKRLKRGGFEKKLFLEKTYSKEEK